MGGDDGWRGFVHGVDLNDASIVHAGYAIGVAEDTIVMGDDDNASTRCAGDGFEKFHDDLAVLRVERGGRLIANDQAGFVDEGTGDGYALLLAAGELGGTMMEAISEAYLGKGFLGACLGVAGGFTLNEQGHAGVLHDAEGGYQVKLLEDESDVLSTESCDGSSAHFVQRLAEDFDFTLVRFQGAGHDADEGGLATPGRADKHHDLTASSLQSDFFEHGESGASVAKGFHDPSQLDGNRMINGHANERTTLRLFWMLLLHEVEGSSSKQSTLCFPISARFGSRPAQ